MSTMAATSRCIIAPGESFAVGLIDRPDRPSLFGRARIGADDPVRGIATSGWRGRSFSLGIADAVTVLAADGRTAPTPRRRSIANAVDLPGHPGIARRPARDLQPDSDLGARLVTREVAGLSARDIGEALENGLAVADDLLGAGPDPRRRLAPARRDPRRGICAAGGSDFTGADPCLTSPCASASPSSRRSCTRAAPPRHGPCERGAVLGRHPATPSPAAMSRRSRRSWSR